MVISTSCMFEMVQHSERRSTHHFSFAEIVLEPTTLRNRITPTTLSETMEGHGNGSCKPLSSSSIRHTDLILSCNEVGFLQDGAPLNHPTIVTRLVQPTYDEVTSILYSSQNDF